MADDKDIREKLAKLEALFARGATAGERAAAGAARERLQAKPGFAADEDDGPEIELKYSFPDVWSVKFFLSRYAARTAFTLTAPPRQRRTTVVVRVRKSSFEQTVAEEFRTLHRELTGYFNETVEHLIADAMRSDGDDETLEQRRLPG